MHALATGVSLNPTLSPDPPVTTSTTTAPVTTTTTAPPAPATASIGDVVVSEGDTGKRIAAATVTLDHPVAVKTTLKVSTRSSSAGLADYTPFTGKTVTFPAGASSQTVPITILGDTAPDGTKSVDLTLTGNTQLRVADGTGTMAIVDDDAPSAAVPELKVSDVRAYEGDGGATKVSFTVALSRPATTTVSVRLSTLSFTASTASDLVARSNVKLSFAAGTQSKLFTISVRDDGTLEPDEAFLLQATTPIGVSITDDVGIGTIANDDSTRLRHGPGRSAGGGAHPGDEPLGDRDRREVRVRPGEIGHHRRVAHPQAARSRSPRQSVSTTAAGSPGVPIRHVPTAWT